MNYNHVPFRINFGYFRAVSVGVKYFLHTTCTTNRGQLSKFSLVQYFEYPNISIKMTTPTPLLFTVGDIVIIDDKDKAYIIESRGETGDLFFKVRFILDNSHLSNVNQARCRVVPIFDSTSNFSSRSCTNRHSDVPAHNTPPLVSEIKTRRSPVQILQETILQTKKFIDRSKASPSIDIHPLM